MGNGTGPHHHAGPAGRIVENNLAAGKYPAIGEDLRTGGRVKMPVSYIKMGSIRKT